MSVTDLLVAQFGALYAIVGRNVAGMTQTDSLASTAGGNSANWILGHLVNVHNQLMHVIGAPPVWESEELHQARFDHPIREVGEAIDWETLVTRFNASRDACLEAIAGLSDEALARETQDPFGNPTDVAGLLGGLVVHQSYHAGQLGMTRRAAGLPTAILAPGQAESL